MDFRTARLTPQGIPLILDILLHLDEFDRFSSIWLKEFC